MCAHRKKSSNKKLKDLAVSSKLMWLILRSECSRESKKVTLQSSNQLTEAEKAIAKSVKLSTASFRWG